MHSDSSKPNLLCRSISVTSCSYCFKWVHLVRLKSDVVPGSNLTDRLEKPIEIGTYSEETSAPDANMTI